MGEYKYANEVYAFSRFFIPDYDLGSKHCILWFKCDNIPWIQQFLEWEYTGEEMYSQILATEFSNPTGEKCEKFNKIQEDAIVKIDSLSPEIKQDLGPQLANTKKEVK